jgi:fumarylacetoacetase
MLELTGEENPIKLNDGTERKFINDNDTVIMKGFCQKQVRIGFEKFLLNSTPLSGNNRYSR